jgi:hypothetical protein
MNTYSGIPGCADFWCVGVLDRFDASLRRSDVVIQIRESL